MGKLGYILLIITCLVYIPTIMPQSFTNTLSIRTFNCRGAMSSCLYIQELLESSDILCLQEHHLLYENVNFLSTLDNDYLCFARCDSRVSTNGTIIRQGGIAILWKTSLSHVITPLSELGDNRIQGIRICEPGKATIFLFNVYLPSANHVYSNYESCLHDLIDIYSYYSNEGIVILAGDFNTAFRLGQRAHVRQYGDRRRTDLFEQFMLSNNLQSLVTHGMCKGPLCTFFPYSGGPCSQIDHVIIQNCHLCIIEHVMVEDEHALNTSDHHPISLRISCRIPRYSAQTRRTYRWDKADSTIYRDTLEGCIIVKGLMNMSIRCPDDIDLLYNELKLSILESSEKCVPKSRFCSYKKPYWSSEIKELYARQKQLRRIWIEEGRPRGSDYPSYVEYKAAKYVFAKTLRKSAARYEQSQYEDVNKFYDMDMKTFWKYARKRKHNDNSVNVMRDENGTYETPDSQLSMWKEHYTNLLNETDANAADFDATFKQFIDLEVEHIADNMDSGSDAPGIDIKSKFTEAEVTIACKSLPKGRAPGIDLISYEHLKYGGTLFIQVLTMLFNEITQMVHIPPSFKMGLLVSLYKGNGKPRESKDSYRGVTLLPSINKLYEKCVINRLNPFLEQMKFPAPLQHACRKGYNNVLLSFLVQESISDHVEKGGKIFSCFLDIEKCFDHIWWNGLFYKMYHMGFINKVWYLLREWFANSQCSVLVNGKISDAFYISRSIKQGGMMSMLNFCIYLYDIHKFVDIGNYGLKCHDIYVGSPALADDVMLMSPTKHGLDKMMDRALKYSKMWRFRFSSRKSKCMVFGESKIMNSRNSQKRTFYMGTNNIEEVSHYCHVGITLCSFLSSKQRTISMCSKGSKILSAMTGIGVKRNGLNPIIGTFLWNKICLPSILHGSELWNDLSKIEMIQLERAQCRALKITQGLPLRTHNYIVRGMVNQMSVMSIIECKKLAFLQKVISMSPGFLHKQLFIRRCYAFVNGNNMKGFVPDIFRILRECQLHTFMYTYLRGGTFPTKIEWKHIIKGSHQLMEARNSTINNEDSLKYINVVRFGGQCNILYRIAKRHPSSSNALIRMARLLSIPNRIGVCVLCGIVYDDIVVHIINVCTVFVAERSSLWDGIIDLVDVHASVELFNMTDEDFTYIVLGKSWHRLSNREHRDRFYSAIASILCNFIYGITANYDWYRP